MGNTCDFNYCTVTFIDTTIPNAYFISAKDEDDIWKDPFFKSFIAQIDESHGVALSFQQFKEHALTILSEFKDVHDAKISDDELRIYFQILSEVSDHKMHITQSFLIDLIIKFLLFADNKIEKKVNEITFVLPLKEPIKFLRNLTRGNHVELHLEIDKLIAMYQRTLLDLALKLKLNVGIVRNDDENSLIVSINRPEEA